MDNLYEWSCEINGARKMLLALLDNYKITSKERDKDSDVYAKAEIDMILSSKENTAEFLSGGSRSGIRYYDHQQNKKGKLISCKAKFERYR